MKNLITKLWKKLPYCWCYEELLYEVDYKVHYFIFFGRTIDVFRWEYR